MARIASLNGLDGSGKSTQVELLGSADGTNLIRKDLSGFPKMSAACASEWWFHPDNHGHLAQALGRLIVSSEKQADNTDAVLYVADRGPTMHLAALTATVMTTDGSDFESAFQRAATLLENIVGVDVSKLGWTELLLKGSHRDNGETNAGHTASQTHRYKSYQENLCLAVERLHADNRDSGVVASGDVVSVQNSIRKILSSKYDIDDSFCRNLGILVGIGGLTESGKSSHAEGLRREEGYFRLKIRAFDQQFKLEHGRRPTSDELAARIAVFIHANAFAQSFSVESIHRPEVHESLKRYFGNRYHLVYIDADREVRRERTKQEIGGDAEEAEIEFEKKEAKKTSRGAHLLLGQADTVIDTTELPFSSTLFTLKEALSVRGDQIKTL